MTVFTKKPEEMSKSELIDELSKSVTERNAIIDCSYDGYWDWYIQENYEYMSPRFWEIFGFLPNEKEHSPSAWQDLIDADDLGNAMNAFKAHVESRGAEPYNLEVRYKHKSGTTVTVQCRGKVIEWDSEGNAIRMIGTHTDLTDKKMNEKILEDKISELERVNKVMVDRELKMIELKKEIETLKTKLKSAA